jgi:hypothetical protein
MGLKVMGLVVIPVLDSVPAALDHRPRLVWSETSRSALRASTLHGTKARDLEPALALGFAAQTSGEQPLLWPRSLAVAQSGAHLLVGEYLGKVWKLEAPPLLPGGHDEAAGKATGEVVVDSTTSGSTGSGAASQIRSFLIANGRSGDQFASSVLRLVS